MYKRETRWEEKRQSRNNGLYFLLLEFPGGSVVKNPPANAGDAGSIHRLGGPPEKEMATHLSILAWEIPWTEEPGGLQPMGSQESDTTQQLTTIKVKQSRIFQKMSAFMLKSCLPNLAYKIHSQTTTKGNLNYFSMLEHFILFF